jgi:hypothetical protein
VLLQEPDDHFLEHRRSSSTDTTPSTVGVDLCRPARRASYRSQPNFINPVARCKTRAKLAARKAGILSLKVGMRVASRACRVCARVHVCLGRQIESPPCAHKKHTAKEGTLKGDVRAHADLQLTAPLLTSTYLTP